MTKRKGGDLDLGFDVVVARDALCSWLIQAHIVSHGEVEELAQALRKAAPPDSPLTEEQVAWGVAEAVGWKHVRRHGVPSEVRTSDGEWKKQPQCTESPCQEVGASAALLEIVNYQKEHSHNANKAADDLSELASQLRGLKPILERVGKSAGEERARWKAIPRGIGRSSRNPWAPAVWLVKLLLFAIGASEGVARQARQVFGTAQSLLEPKRRGRPKHALLSAVWTHLRKNGWSQTAAFRLVPDTNPVRGTDHQVRRLRQHVEGEDFRGFDIYRPPELKTENPDI